MLCRHQYRQYFRHGCRNHPVVGISLGHHRVIVQIDEQRVSAQHGLCVDSRRAVRAFKGIAGRERDVRIYRRFLFLLLFRRIFRIRRSFFCSLSFRVFRRSRLNRGCIFCISRFHIFCIFLCRCLRRRFFFGCCIAQQPYAAHTQAYDHNRSCYEQHLFAPFSQSSHLPDLCSFHLSLLLSQPLL